MTTLHLPRSRRGGTHSLNKALTAALLVAAGTLVLAVSGVAQEVFAGRSGTEVPLGEHDGSFFGTGLRPPDGSAGVVLPVAGTASHLYVSVLGATITPHPVETLEAYFEVLKNGHVTNLLVYFFVPQAGANGGGFVLEDLVGQVSFAAGDTIAIRIINIGDYRYSASWSLVYK